MGFNFKKAVFERMSAVAMLIASACTPTPLDVHGVPQLQPKIVVSSQLLPDFAVAVLLTTSFGALEATDESNPEALLDQIIIKDAVVRLEGNGMSYELKYIQSGVYGISAPGLIINESYTLYVDSPSAGSVSATTTAKAQVLFEYVNVKLTPGPDTLTTVTYSIRDSIGKNWYMINAQHVTRVNFEKQLLDPLVTTKIFDDSGFEGTVKRDSFQLLVGRAWARDTVTVLLSNIDEGYYNFMKKREDTRFGLASYLGEPVNYPSNVNGGLGYFTLCVPDIRRFIVE